jgi:hypothetical protein
MNNYNNKDNYQNFIQETCQKFKKDVIEIIQIFKDNLDFNDYFQKFSKINDKDLRVSYFSKKKFMSNDQKYQEFVNDSNDYQKLLQKIIQKNINFDKKNMIKLINKKLESEYILNLTNSNLYQYFIIPKQYNIIE